MDTRLLKKLRDEARKSYGVEKRNNKVFEVITYTGAGKCVISKYNSLVDARRACDIERANHVYCKALNIREARVKVKRVY